MATLASALGELTGISWKAPVALASNPRMVRMYAKQDNNDLVVQIGTDVSKPSRMAVFNGKDWSTGVPDNSKRNVNATLTPDEASGIAHLDGMALAYAKAHKKEWFPAQPSISDEQIEKLYCSALKQSTHGPEMVVKIDRIGDKTSKLELSAYEERTGSFVPYNLPISSDPNRPTNIDGLLVSTYYVWVSTKPNGKKIDQWGLKAAPMGIMHVRDSVTSSGPALDAPVAPLPSSTSEVTIGELSEWNDQGFAFADIGSVSTAGSGRRFTLGDKHFDIKLWQAYGECGVGTAVSADVLLDGDAAAAVSVVDDAVRDLLYKRFKELGASGSGEIDECLTPALRGANQDYPPYVRFAIDKTAIVRSGTPLDQILEGDARSAALQVDGKAPARVRGRAIGLRLYLCVKRDTGGTLESIAIKIGAAGLEIAADDGTSGASSSMFHTGTLPLSEVADAAPAVTDKRPSPDIDETSNDIGPPMSKKTKTESA